MHYLGSKARHAKEIIAITCANRTQGQYYVEPFVGGGNVINKVSQAVGPRIANDKNRFMVALLDSLGNFGWEPPGEMTKREWQPIMRQKQSLIKDREQMALFAFAATGPTFGSMWCGQWAKDYPGQEGTRYRQSRDAALKDAPGLKGIQFYDGSYDDLLIPDDPSIIYCDPPYRGTTDYAGAKTLIKVDEDLSGNNWKAGKFWKWADMLVEHGHFVFVSEYCGPLADIYGCEDVVLKTSLSDAQGKWRSWTSTVNSASDAERNAVAKQYDFVGLQAEIADINARISAARQVLADRWKHLWEKEVTSDFSATRGTSKAVDEGEDYDEVLPGQRNVSVAPGQPRSVVATHIAKTNIETLFHRAP